MPPNAAQFAVLFGLAAFAATVQGFTGFGFGMLGVGVCTFLIGPQDANVLWTVVALGLTSGMWWRTREHSSWRLVVPLAIGAFIGLPPGLWILKTGSTDLLERLIGTFLLLFAGYSLANPDIKPRALSAWWGVAAGTAGGFVSGICSMGGPTAVIFLLLIGQEKEGIRANLAGYFTLTVVLKLGMLGLGSHLLTWDHAAWGMLLWVPVAGGVAVGMRASRHVSSIAMRRGISAMLLIPGVLLLLG